MFVYVCCLRNIEPHTVTIRPLKKKKSRYFFGITNTSYVLKYFFLFPIR